MIIHAVAGLAARTICFIAVPLGGKMSTASSFHAEPNPTEKIMQSALGFMKTGALHAVCSLGVPDLLKNSPAHVASLAKSTSSNEDALYRVLRALASMGIFTETSPRTFALTSSGELLV